MVLETLYWSNANLIKSLFWLDPVGFYIPIICTTHSFDSSNVCLCRNNQNSILFSKLFLPFTVQIPFLRGAALINVNIFSPKVTLNKHEFWCNKKDPVSGYCKLIEWSFLGKFSPFSLEFEKSFPIYFFLTAGKNNFWNKLTNLILIQSRSGHKRNKETRKQVFDSFKGYEPNMNLNILFITTKTKVRNQILRH